MLGLGKATPKRSAFSKGWKSEGFVFPILGTGLFFATGNHNMVWLFSAGLWLLLGVSLWRASRDLGSVYAQARQVVYGLAALFVLALPLYLRPHEEITGGEDPGAYINSAVTFSRTDHLRYVDPLLVQIPEADRAAFLYGHKAFKQTKDACLWVKDLETAEIGPWFQPAYSVLLSLPLKFLPPWCVLYGAPLLALLSALALAAVGAQLLGRRLGSVLTALFFLLNPIVLWNGRSPRAEWGAVLFFWLGLALILRSWRSPGERRTIDFVFGALCLLVAPFFHITAWLGVAPVIVVLLIKSVLGRRLFMLIIPVAVGGLFGFLTQLVEVTDCYGLLPRIQPLLQHPRWIIAGAAVLWLALLALCGRLAPPAGPAKPMADRKPNRVAWVLWLALLVAGVAIWLGRDEKGQLPWLPAYMVNYFSLTNLRGLALLVSRLVLVVALAGWAAWLFRRGAHADLRLGLAVALLPGLLLTGWMNNYMMESRRMLLFPAPVMALALAAVVLWLWERRSGWGRLAAVGLSALVLAAMWRGRTHLATHVETPGLYRACANIAAPMQQAHGWLLAEYSQLAAPQEHLFGIPTLAMDTDYHAELAPVAERAWAQLMRAHPGRACFFVTPFQPPYSEYFVFTPERREVYRGPTLIHELGRLPRRITDYSVTLSLYRMALRTPRTTANENVRFPQLFKADAGNMGLHGFANLREENWAVRGLALPAKTGVQIPLDGARPLLAGDGLYFIFRGPFRPDARPRVAGNFTGIREVHWIHLADEWWVLRLRGALRFERACHIHSTVDALLSDVVLHHDGICQSLTTGWPEDEVTTQPLPTVRARWTVPKASFSLPVSDQTNGELFIYAAAPEAVGPTMTMRVAGRGATNISPVKLVTGAPRWYVFRDADIGLTPMHPVVTLMTDQPWRHTIRGFPPELGLLLAYAVSTD